MNLRRCLRGAAGIDGQDRAGDARRLVAEQELDRVRHVLDRRKTLKRAAPRHLGAREQMFAGRFAGA